MKNVTLTLIAFIWTIFMQTAVVANDGKYQEAMQKNIKAVYEAKSIDSYQQTVNSFERIGEAEKTKWEPFYYASFGYIMMANVETERNKRDAYLDQAVTAIKKAKALAPGESEITALEGFAYMIRLSIDPATRGQEYAGLAMQTLSKAVGMNNNNPRALSLLAQMQYGTAQFFGSPTTEACGTLTTALEKFNTFTSDNALAPRWGKSMAESLKANCQ
jgi:tetratricopeptide (TPR) repeat protein